MWLSSTDKEHTMKLTKPQLETLHILWSSDTPLSLQEITDRSKCRFAGGLIVSTVIGNLLEKDAVYRAGAFDSHFCNKN